MTTRRTSSRSLKPTLGATIFALGLLLLFVNLDGAAGWISGMLGTPERTPELLATLGLAGLNAVQAYTFNHDAFLSALRQILVSCWPLMLILAGAMLLRDVFGSLFRANGSHPEYPTAGERR
jgi:hypothetical protein